MKLINRITPYRNAFFKLFIFCIISSLIPYLCSLGLSQLSTLLLGLDGKASVSSGDFGFIFTSWQGWVVLLLTAALILLYVALEINALVFYCAQIVDGKKTSMLLCFRDGILALKKYLNPHGLVVILYVTLLFPIIGLGIAISSTSSFYIPRFISSVIYANPLYATGYSLLILALIVLFVIYCFILHGALLDDMRMKQSAAASRRIIRQHLKNFIWEMIRFYLIYLVVIIIVFAALVAIPYAIAYIVPASEVVHRFFYVFFSLITVLLITVFKTVSSSLVMMKTTALYRGYTSNGNWELKPPAKSKTAPAVAGISVLLVLIAGFSFISAFVFDNMFPQNIDTQIVAHRAGGDTAPENTVSGIRSACSLNASGAEIDIQRTSDGHYIVNHDDTFERVAGVNKKPSEMTLGEIKKLNVDGEPVATLEEMLEACRDKLTLFVELKGETADERMADDAVKIIKNMGMEKQAVLISLKYDVLEYIEEKYPEMDTGYLMFFSFGKIEDNPFDYLALEEEICTFSTVDAIHDNGKKVMVWTVNEDDPIRQFLLSEADMIITDRLVRVNEIREELLKRSPAERVFDTLDFY